jgi:hypothetical protein
VLWQGGTILALGKNLENKWLGAIFGGESGIEPFARTKPLNQRYILSLR